MPVPRAVIIRRISSEESILSRRAFSTFRILPLSGSTAWKRRSRPCLAEPPAESPSTKKISQNFGSRSWQSASLPGSDAESSAPLRRVSSRALRAASLARALFEVVAEALVHHLLDPRLHVRGDQLVLRLRRELRVADLDGDHGRET